MPSFPPIRLVLGRMRLDAKGAPAAIAALVRYGARIEAGIPAVMRASEARLKAGVKARTPVRSGHLRDSVLSTSDIAEVTDQYEVFVREQEFQNVVNSLGELVDTFYGPPVYFGTRHTVARDPMTPAAEEEGPLLVRDLTELFRSAAR